MDVNFLHFNLFARRVPSASLCVCVCVCVCVFPHVPASVAAAEGSEEKISTEVRLNDRKSDLMTGSQA